MSISKRLALIQQVTHPDQEKKLMVFFTIPKGGHHRALWGYFVTQDSHFVALNHQYHKVDDRSDWYYTLEELTNNLSDSQGLYELLEDILKNDDMVFTSETDAVLDEALSFLEEVITRDQDTLKGREALISHSINLVKFVGPYVRYTLNSFFSVERAENEAKVAREIEFMLKDETLTLPSAYFHQMEKFLTETVLPIGDWVPKLEKIRDELEELTRKAQNK